ncbi:MAG: D-aminoacyl-tRNA deacylase [Armatimonadota bacterium]|nr:D-aminoacyl-tRNA deacylase [Armatimonadota bacterium]MDR7440326.1 D-aminoacyl-tRNA deacylase [Armatimonadota bacterium]MDR7562761.1 D-aminoacyl-tRNA deacylase [Armatimonadota bacterium]MDR7568265.1 D-aminoacyl-tRNA deacylase [Armatimonadota bacterium]MDR7602946.1 D-aminoacyl-tRNA deacylase [Armatimonadota bacterium]
MRAVVQRVSRGAVRVQEELVAEIGRGLVVLVGVHIRDAEEDARWLARKVAQLRVFPDEAGKLNRSVLEVGGSVLSISQFTLYGDVRKGNRPSFVEAAPPDVARRLYDAFNEALRMLGVPVRTGVFGAVMQVEIFNDGPVTVLLDTAEVWP